MGEELEEITMKTDVEISDDGRDYFVRTEITFPTDVEYKGELYSKLVVITKSTPGSSFSKVSLITPQDNHADKGGWQLIDDILTLRPLIEHINKVREIMSLYQ